MAKRTKKSSAKRKTKSGAGSAARAKKSSAKKKGAAKASAKKAGGRAGSKRAAQKRSKAGAVKKKAGSPKGRGPAEKTKRSKKMTPVLIDESAGGGVPMLTAPKKSRSSARSLLFDSQAQRAEQTSLVKQSKESRGARKDRQMQTAWNVKSVRGVAGLTRRNQAKRDGK